MGRRCGHQLYASAPGGIPVTSALMPTYARADLAFERGDGAYLFTADGHRYLDFASGIGVTLLGHSHPRLVAALKDQADRIWHCSNVFRIPEQQRLAERLVARSFADTVFFCNSGAEAVECAIKLVRKFFDHAKAPRRTRIIAFEGAFHGRTLATIAAGGQAKHLAGFGPPVSGFDHVPFGNIDAVAEAIGDETAGILIEPIQGEGGVRAADPAFLLELRNLADAHGLLLVFDEVQCGMGRTGHLFAHERAGVSPDVLALAKGLGGGVPVGACLATSTAAVGLTAGSHGSTFGGNPLAMAVANAVLDVVLEEEFLDRVRATGSLLHDRLAELSRRFNEPIVEVRGVGLMLGLRIRGDSREMVAALRERGLLTVAAAENVVRLLPPLIINESHVNEAMIILEDALRSGRL